MLDFEQKEETERLDNASYHAWRKFNSQRLLCVAWQRGFVINAMQPALGQFIVEIFSLYDKNTGHSSGS